MGRVSYHKTRVAHDYLVLQLHLLITSDGAGSVGLVLVITYHSGYLLPIISVEDKETLLNLCQLWYFHLITQVLDYTCASMASQNTILTIILILTQLWPDVVVYLVRAIQC